MGEFWSVLGFTVLAAGVVIMSAAIVITGRGSASPISVLRSRFHRSAAASPAAASAGEVSSPPSAALPAAVPAMDRQSRIAASTPLGASGAVHEDAESLIGRTLLAAQKNAEDVLRAAQARADEIIGNAEAVAHGVVQAAQSEAVEIVQKAREEADMMMGTATERATGWLALLQAEADRLVLEVHQSFRQAQRSVEQSVAAFPARLERCAPDGAAAPSSNGHGRVIDRHAADLARSLALAEGEAAASLAGAAVTPPPMDGRMPS